MTSVIYSALWVADNFLRQEYRTELWQNGIHGTCRRHLTLSSGRSEAKMPVRALFDSGVTVRGDPSRRRVDPHIELVYLDPLFREEYSREVLGDPQRKSCRLNISPRATTYALIRTACTIFYGGMSGYRVPKGI